MFQYHPCLIIRDSFPFIDFCLQSIFVALLDDENYQIFIFIDVKTLEEVWALAFIHEFWFRFSQYPLDYPYNLAIRFYPLPQRDLSGRASLPNWDFKIIVKRVCGPICNWNNVPSTCRLGSIEWRILAVTRVEAKEGMLAISLEGG